ncbi:unnamed protein product, partial [Nesidiocoris tenuis]
VSRVTPTSPNAAIHAWKLDQGTSEPDISKAWNLHQCPTSPNASACLKALPASPSPTHRLTVPGVHTRRTDRQIFSGEE